MYLTLFGVICIWGHVTGQTVNRTADDISDVILTRLDEMSRLQRNMLSTLRFQDKRLKRISGKLKSVQQACRRPRVMTTTTTTTPTTTATTSTPTTTPTTTTTTTMNPGIFAKMKMLGYCELQKKYLFSFN